MFWRSGDDVPDGDDSKWEGGADGRQVEQNDLPGVVSGDDGDLSVGLLPGVDIERRVRAS